MDKIKYLDTYALCEISQGNANFTKYFEKDFIINELTLTEFYGLILREYDEKTAGYWLNKLLPYTKTVKLDVLIKAMKFKINNSKKNISFFDSVGYIFALENNCVFVTGDKEFEKLKEVEFVKK